MTEEECFTEPLPQDPNARPALCIFQYIQKDHVILVAVFLYSLGWLLMAWQVGMIL